MRYIVCQTWIVMFVLGSPLLAQDNTGDTLILAPVIIQATPISGVYKVDSINAIELTSVSHLTDALRHRAGLYVRDSGSGGIASVSMRGGGPQHTNLYWNGMPINSPTLGQSDISLMPSIFITGARVELGASSLLSGTGGLGGSLSLDSDVGRPAQGVTLVQRFTPMLGGIGTDAALRYKGGSWSARTAFHRYSAENSYAYVDDSHREPVERQREHAAQSSMGLAQDMTFTINSKDELSLHVQGLLMDREVPANIGLPTKGDRQNDEVVRLATNYRHSGDRSSHVFGLGASFENQKFHFAASQSDSEVDTRFVQARYSYSKEIGNHGLLRLRIDHELSVAQVDQVVSVNRNRTGVFIGMEQSLGEQIQLDAGVRLQQMDFQSRPATGSLGLRYSPVFIEGLKLRAAISRNFRDPTLNDLYWPSLGDINILPEQGYSMEVGVSQERGSHQLSITVYQSRFNDLIIWQPSIDGRHRPINLANANNRGLEARAQLQNLLENYSIEIQSTLIEAQVKEVKESQWSARIYQPWLFGQVRVKGHYEYFEWDIGYGFQSEVLTDYSDQAKSDPLQVVHDIELGAIYRPKRLKCLAIGGRIRNIMNINYEYIRDRPIAGRHFTLTFTIDLNETL